MIKKLKTFMMNVLLAIFGVNLLKKMLSGVKNLAAKMRKSADLFFIHIPIFNPIFSIIYKKTTQESFDRFINYKGNFDKFVSSVGVKKMFFESKENKVYFLNKFKVHAQKIGRKDMIPIFNECILAYDPGNTQAREDLMQSYKELIISSFESQNVSEFEYYVSKLKPLDSIFARYYEFLARKKVYNDVSSSEWDGLLEEAKKTGSALAEKISTQIQLS